MIARKLPRWRARWRRGWWLLPVLAVCLVLPRLLPKPPLAAAAPSSRSVYAAGGELLRLTLAADEQYRLWTPIGDIAEPLQQAVLLYEDRWFQWHPGVNPWALARAGASTLVGSRRMGGSTVTMQLARRLYRIDSRTARGKFKQVFGALWLELRYSKREIFEAYLNFAPYGGNIEGAGAASLVYLRKPARSLSVPEALTLAVIPQNPKKRIGEEGDKAELKAARARLAADWVVRNPHDARYAGDAALGIALKTRASMPFLAPHAVTQLLRESQQREIRASVDLRVQSTIERVLGEYVKARADVGISNATALLVDASTMEVKALVGSSDYGNASIAGQVNGALAKRSPGSTLKPFIYALALDQGLIHSASVLKDAPSSFGGFSPENFDGRFAGPMPAQDALIRSRNVPAVALAARLSTPGLYDFLKLGGVQKMAPESHYGLALVLGGGDVTMEELARLYSVLANRGVLRDLRYTREPRPAVPERPAELLSEEAAFITLDMLRRTPRPDTFAPARPAIAWKTGTSWGFRDAWTAGVFGRYVLVVWVGNFDGSSNAAFVGIEAAAPLFLRIADALRAERLDPGEIAQRLPANLGRVEVCAASGDLPNDECHVRSTAWFIAGKSPIRQSTLHRTVYVDTRTRKAVCGPGPNARAEVYEYWSSDMQRLFKHAGLPVREPPTASECAGAAPEEAAPRIVLPLRGVTHIMRVARPEPIALRADASAAAGRLFWFANDAMIGEGQAGQTLSWQPPQPGRYVLRAVDNAGRADSRELVIEPAQ